MSSFLELPDIASQNPSLPLEQPHVKKEEKRNLLKFRLSHVLILIVTLYAIFEVVQTLSTIRFMNQEIASLNQQKVELEQTNLCLEDEINKLNDPLYIEQIAKEKLLLIKPNEILLMTIPSSNK